MNWIKSCLPSIMPGTTEGCGESASAAAASAAASEDCSVDVDAAAVKYETASDGEDGREEGRHDGGSFAGTAAPCAVPSADFSTLDASTPASSSQASCQANGSGSGPTVTPDASSCKSAERGGDGSSTANPGPAAAYKAAAVGGSTPDSAGDVAGANSGAVADTSDAPSPTALNVNAATHCREAASVAPAAAGAAPPAASDGSTFGAAAAVVSGTPPPSDARRNRDEAAVSIAPPAHSAAPGNCAGVDDAAPVDQVDDSCLGTPSSTAPGASPSKNYSGSTERGAASASPCASQTQVTGDLAAAERGGSCALDVSEEKAAPEGAAPVEAPTCPTFIANAASSGVAKDQDETATGEKMQNHRGDAEQQDSADPQESESDNEEDAPPPKRAPTRRSKKVHKASVSWHAATPQRKAAMKAGTDAYQYEDEYGNVVSVVSAAEAVKMSGCVRCSMHLKGKRGGRGHDEACPRKLKNPEQRADSETRSIAVLRDFNNPPRPASPSPAAAAKARRAANGDGKSGGEHSGKSSEQKVSAAAPAKAAGGNKMAARVDAKKSANNRELAWKCHRCSRHNPLDRLKCPGCMAVKGRSYSSTRTSTDGCEIVVGVERNSDECDVCGGCGELICCDGCDRAYHGKCLDVEDASALPDRWLCPACCSCDSDSSLKDAEPSVMVVAAGRMTRAQMRRAKGYSDRLGETSEDGDDDEVDDGDDGTGGREDEAGDDAEDDGKKASLKRDDDYNPDECYICYDGGLLVCCDYCEKAFHTDCHIPPILDVDAIPGGKWKCCECTARSFTKLSKCGECDACLREDCGKCVYCLDKPKFGGLLRLKQVCEHKRCPNKRYAPPATPHPERMKTNVQNDGARGRKREQRATEEEAPVMRTQSDCVHGRKRKQRATEEAASASHKPKRACNKSSSKVKEVVRDAHSTAAANIGATPSAGDDSDDDDASSQSTAQVLVVGTNADRRGEGASSPSRDLLMCQMELARVNEENKRKDEEIKRLKAAIQALTQTLTG